VNSLRDLEDTLEMGLSQGEFVNVLWLDVLIKGRRAALLGKAGYATAPVVAGERVTPDAEDEAQPQGVPVLLDERALTGRQPWTASRTEKQEGERR